MLKTLGARLRQCRRDRGLTQAGVARSLGVARVSVTLWEGDKTRPSLDHLLRLAKLFDVSSDWLLTGLEPTRPNVQRVNRDGASSIV
jgi:transcriptional regulator with XRE-family HTH domain